MITCPFCHFENEDGALFCEQCKSDLSGVVPAPAIPVAHAMPMEAMPVLAEAVPVEAEGFPAFGEAIPVVAEAMPVFPEAEPVVAEAVPHEAFPAFGQEAAMPAVPAPMAEAVPVIPMGEPPAASPVNEAPSPGAQAPPAAAPAPLAAAVAAPAGAAAPGGSLPAGAQPRLQVLRGLKRNAEYPIYEGPNFIGRSDDKPVDIDLEDQEPPDRIWCSRQHACIFFENNVLELEDLNSANGTYVNRERIYPGAKKVLAVNDVIQIGNVQMKVIA